MSAKDPFPDRAALSTLAGIRRGTSGLYRDLCSNCDNAGSCEGRTRPRRPIFFCEEFMVFGAAPAPEPAPGTQPQTQQASGINGHIGLCMNCESADTCTLPKPAGGIWHCEEYH